MNGQQTSAGPHRRAVLTAGGALLTSSIFTGKVKGANDRLALAVIGMGNMGTGHLRRLLKMPEVAVKSVCDVYAPNLERAVAVANGKVPGVKDFRKILADRSVDAVCIAAPDHWGLVDVIAIVATEPNSSSGLSAQVRTVTTPPASSKQ